MPRILEGGYNGKGKRFGIVASRFNEFITSKLVNGAVDALLRHDVSDEDIEIAWVSGAFEVPLVAQKMASSGRYSAVICLGAVIRGQTAHFDYVAGECARGIGRISVETGVPAIFGIITAETLEQAVDRAGARLGNRGADAAMAAIEMSNLLDNLS